jgi:hypothetical protein
MKSLKRISTILGIVLVSIAPMNALAASSMVRVIHASPDAPAVDLIVDDMNRAVNGLAFGQYTDYLALPANVYNIKVVPEGGFPVDSVINADLSLFYYEKYTVLAVNSLSSIEPLVLLDDYLPLQQGKAKLRFVHASPDAPAVDIKVVDGPYLFQNISFREYGDYVTLPKATVDVEVRVAGTDTVVLTIPGVTVNNGTAYSVYAIGLAGGTPGLSVLLTIDGAVPATLHHKK